MTQENKPEAAADLPELNSTVLLGIENPPSGDWMKIQLTPRRVVFLRIDQIETVCDNNEVIDTGCGIGMKSGGWYEVGATADEVHRFFA